MRTSNDKYKDLMDYTRERDLWDMIDEKEEREIEQTTMFRKYKQRAGGNNDER